MIQKITSAFIIFLITFLPGCASVLSQAVIDKSASISFQEAKEHVGKIIILGGTIINAVGTPKGIEWEVLQRQLGYGMEPLINDKSFGRFIVQSDSMMAVSLFKKGQKIAVAGEIVGTETRPLDQTSYTYLVLRLKEYHVWTEGGRGYFPILNFSFGVNTDF